MSQKFDMPLLQRHVLNFLLSSVAGKPIEAMKIAEEHQLPELYRESSRFLLDNWQGWDHKELESLSSATLLKLEKRSLLYLIALCIVVSDSCFLGAFILSSDGLGS